MLGWPRQVDTRLTKVTSSRLREQPRHLMSASGFHTHVDTCAWVYVLVHVHIYPHTEVHGKRWTWNRCTGELWSTPTAPELGAGWCSGSQSGSSSSQLQACIRFRFPKFPEAPLKPPSPHPLFLLCFKLHHRVFFYYLQSPNLDTPTPTAY